MYPLKLSDIMGTEVIGDEDDVIVVHSASLSWSSRFKWLYLHSIEVSVRLAFAWPNKPENRGINRLRVLLGVRLGKYRSTISIHRRPWAYTALRSISS